MLYTSQGGEVINMTQYPEVVLAREMEICFLGIALITDYDVGLSAKRKVKAVDSKEVIRVFNQNLEKSRKLILEIIKNIPAKRDCLCATALEEARIN